VCGLIVACICAQSLCAHDLIRKDNNVASSGTKQLQLSGHIWPVNRQILPSPFAAEILHASLIEVESPKSNLGEAGPSAGTSRDGINGDAESNLEARVRALEAKGDDLSDGDDS